MLPATSKRTRKKVTRFPGICAFAKSAGVDRVHAFKVLRGERTSVRLIKLWKQFQAEQK